MVALVVFGAGCFSDRGIAIEIDVGSTGATSVELYVGNRRCTGPGEQGFRCDGGIAPPSIAAHLDGDVWYRDDRIPYFAVVKDGKATFRLQADLATTLPIAIAVGSKGPETSALGTATLRDVAVPVDDARIVRATLVAAGEVQPSTGSATEDRAMVWNQREDGVSSCVVVEHWSNGQVDRDFIVPPDDPDCDHIADECDPGAYLGSQLASADDAVPQCLIAPTNDTTDAACKLGAFGCTDQDGPDSTCARLVKDVCVPRTFCSCPRPSPGEQCLQEKLEEPAETIPHIVCTVRATRDEACPDASDPIDLRGQLRNATCEQPVMSELSLDGLASPSKSRTFGGVDLELTQTGKGQCRFTVKVNDNSPGSPERQDRLGAIQLRTEDGIVLLPIRFKFESPLPEPLPDPLPPVICVEEKMQCDLSKAELDDPMWTCAQPVR